MKFEFFGNPTINLEMTPGNAEVWK